MLMEVMLIHLCIFFHFRKSSRIREYVCAIKNELVILEDGKKPEALELCLRLSCCAYNVAVTLHNADEIDSATSLARVACESGKKWYSASSHEHNAFIKVRGINIHQKPS